MLLWHRQGDILAACTAGMAGTRILCHQATTPADSSQCTQVLLRWCVQGWRVFAGVRQKQDAESLEQLHEGITPILLDVTS